MSAPWSLPAYQVELLLGAGSTAEVWRGRELASGRPVALRRLRAAADPEALRLRAELLDDLDCPYVVGLRGVAGDGDVLVLDLAAGGSLASLLERRCTLGPGEVVTVAAPIAQALAAVHARGLVHGNVSPANVLLTGEGMPLLSELWTSAARPAAEYLDPVLVAGAEPTPASDVWSLAAVCHHLLAGRPPHEGTSVLRPADGGCPVRLGRSTPSVPPELVEAVETALSHDPSLRPDAAAFASALLLAHAAAPVRFDGMQLPEPPRDVRPAHASPRHAATSSHVRGARPRPGWLVPAAVAAVLLCAAWLGWWSGRGPDPQPAAVPLPQAAVVGPAWPQVLDGLDAVRARSFAAADPDVLAEAYAPGSPGLAADRALVEHLAAQGHRAAGVRHEVRTVDELGFEAGRARLRVVDVLAPYRVRDVRGAVVSRFPGRGEAAHVVELVRTGQGWRLVQVRPG